MSAHEQPALPGAEAFDWDDEEEVEEGEEEEAYVRAPTIRRARTHPAADRGYTPHRQKEEPRNLSIPIWESVSLFDDSSVYRLRIWRVSEENEPHNMGFLPADAGEEHLINKYKKAGRYLVMPIDSNGQKQREYPYKVIIPEDHPQLRRLLHGGAFGAPTAGGAVAGIGGFGTAIPPEIWDLFGRQEDRFKTEINDIRMRSETREEALAARESQVRSDGVDLDKARLALSENSTDKALELHTTLVERDNTRTEHFMAQQQTGWAQMMSMSDARHAQDLERQQSFFSNMFTWQNQKFELEQARISADVEKSRLELEAQRNRDAADLERRRGEQEDFYARRETLTQMEAKQSKSWLQAWMGMNQQQNAQAKDANDPMANLERMMMMKAAFDELGGGGNGNQDRGVVGEVADVFKAWVGAQAGLAAGPPPQQIPQQTEEVYDFETGQMMAGVPPVEGVQVGPPMPGTADIASLAAMQNGHAPPPPQPQEPLHTHPAPQTARVPPSKPADPVDALPRDVRQAARRAILQMVDGLRQTDEGQWIAVITAGLTQTPVTVDYLRAATLRRALRDAGAEEGLVERVITAVDASPIVPQDIPRG